ncbi:hypothetical protein B0O99DRAFT_525684 [Bisporella sp. PMI_857]|nr:hypothetical protein B0O99DRAFT_525684 [Bisporella sp. PMI_857]
MKFTSIAVAALLPFVALSAPTPVTELGGANVESRTAAPAELEGADATLAALEKRDIVGTVDADALKYRRCPRTSCNAVGQYPRGTRVTMECFTTASTTTVNGDP